MEVAAVILDHVKGLTWPLLVLILELQFRIHLGKFLDRVATDSEELSGPGGFTVKFRQSTVDEQAERLQQESDTSSEATLPRERPATSRDVIAREAGEPLLNKYLLAEELVLRTLEARWSVPTQRQAAIELGGGRL